MIDLWISTGVSVDNFLQKTNVLGTDVLTNISKNGS